MEFTPEQEKAIQKAIGEGEVLPDISPVSLYDAIVEGLWTHGKCTGTNVDYYPPE
jgi:hypothetical protein